MLLTSSSSKAMIRENFIRFWPIPVLTVLAYFVTGMLPVMTSYKLFNAVSSYAETFMMGGNIVMNMIVAGSAVVAAAEVFSYLHDPVSVISIHALPVNRKKLFASAALSGWLFVVLPIIVIAFAFLTLRGASSVSSEAAADIMGIYGNTHSAKEVFTPAHSIVMIVNGMVTATNCFAICALAAVLSGKKVIHVLLSMFLVVLPLLLVGQISSVCSIFLAGYNGESISYDKMSVLAYMVGKDKFAFDWAYLLYYLAMAVFILIISQIIYSKVKLERVGQSCTFPAVADALCIVLTFIIGIGMAEILSLFSSEEISAGWFIITSLITSTIVYLIMRMIADSTVSVFNLKTAMKYMVYLAIFAVFMATTAFDITGFEKRMPAAADVDSVVLDVSVPFENFDKTEYTDQGVIESALEFQKALVETNDVKTSDEPVDSMVDIEWKLKNGHTVKRSYSMRFGKTKALQPVEDATRKLFAHEAILKSFGDYYAESFKFAKSIDTYSESENPAFNGEVVTIEKKDWAELEAAIYEDAVNRSFEQLFEIDEEYPDICISLMLNRPSESLSFIDDNVVFWVRETDTKTMKFLKDKGYYKALLAEE